MGLDTAERRINIRDIERVLIVGAGSLGSIYGAFLSRAGIDVQLLCRESHAMAIRDAGGLRMVSGDDERHVPLVAEWKPSEIEPADVIMVFTKTFDTVSALNSIRHVRSSMKMALSLQNGVYKDDLLAQWAGKDRVVGSVSMVGGRLVQPGLVYHTFHGPTIIGDLPKGSSRRTHELGEVLKSAGLECVVSDDVRAVEWSKLIHVIPSMALPGLTRLPLHQVLLSRQLAEIYVALVRETAAVAAALGQAIDDGPIVFPVSRIADASSNAEAIRLVQEQGERLVERGMTDVRVSMLQSIERGHRLEIESIHGWVVNQASELGVPVPTVEMCYKLLAGIDLYIDRT